METGTVKFFLEQAGYGFIIDDKNQKEHFIHFIDLWDVIREGDRVSFELQKTDQRKGLSAVNVHKLD